MTDEQPMLRRANLEEMSDALLRWALNSNKEKIAARQREIEILRNNQRELIKEAERRGLNPNENSFRD